MMKRKFWAILLTLLMVFQIAAPTFTVADTTYTATWGDDPMGAEPNEGTAITVETESTEVAVGGTLTLTPKYTFTDPWTEDVVVYTGEAAIMASEHIPALSWSSDDESVATVANGVVTGVAAGTAKITVSGVNTAYSGITFSCEVPITVTAPEPVSTATVYTAENVLVQSYNTLGEAITAATAGQKIVLSEGEFDIEGVPAEGVTITGAGKDKTTIFTSAVGNVIANKNVTIEKVKIDGRAASGVYYSGAINIRGDGAVIKDCDVSGGGQGTWGAGIALSLKKGETAYITNCTLSGAFRGVFIGSAIANVVIDGCVITPGAYCIHVDGDSPDTSLTVSNSTLKGWTSYSAIGSATFTNVSFEEGEYDYLRPYSNTTLISCHFDDEFQLDVLEGLTHTLIDCYRGDTLITQANYKSILHRELGTIKANIASIGGTTYVDFDEAVAAAEKNSNNKFYINPSEKLSEGYTVVENTDGTFTVMPAVTYVAQIGGQGYESLAAALKAAKNGDTVEMLADAAMGEAVTLPENATITILQNGFEITDGYVIVVPFDTTVISDVMTNRFVAPGIDYLIEWVTTGNTYTYTVSQPTSPATLTHGGVDTNYAKAADAMNASRDGDTVTLNQNVTEDLALKATDINGVNSGSVTLNMNDKTVSGQISSVGGTTLTVTGNGTVNYSSSGSAYVKAIYAYGGSGALVMENGTVNSTGYALASAPGYNDTTATLTVNGGTYTGATAAILVEQASGKVNDVARTNGGSITINGGTFNGAIVVNAGTLVIRGGTFDHDPSAWVAEGYEATENNGIWTVAEIVVAQVGETNYTDLQTAINEANGKTVTLLHNVDFGHVNSWTTSLFVDEIEVTLDLAGFEITGEYDVGKVFLVRNGGQLTITDSSANHTGKIIASRYERSSYAVQVNADSKLIVNGGTLQGYSQAIYINGGTVEINAGTVQAQPDNSADAIAFNGPGTLTINGGTLKGTKYVIFGSDAGLCTITITGGTIQTTAAKAALAVCNNDVITISGNPVFEAAYILEARCTNNGSTVAISGGDFTDCTNLFKCGTYTNTFQYWQVTISGGTYASDPSQEQVEGNHHFTAGIAEGKTVLQSGDVYVVGTVATAAIDTDSFTTATEPVEIAPAADVKVVFDAAAAKQIAQNADDRDVMLKVENVTTAAQAVANVATFQITMVTVVNDVPTDEVFSHENAAGSATVTVPFTANGSDNPVVVYLVVGDTKTAVPCTYENGLVTFTVEHFSTYSVEQQADSVAKITTSSGNRYYTSLADAFADVSNNETIELLANVTLTERLFVNAGANPVLDSNNRYATTSENKSITLDLNGHNIASASNIALAGGSLNITGTGTISTSNSGLAPIEVRGTGDLSSKRTLTIGEDVVLDGGTYGLNIFGSNDNQKNKIDVEVNGTVNGILFVLGNLKNTENEINIVVNGTVEAPAGTTSPNVGIALNGYANVTVNNGAVISGDSGIEVRAGNLTVNGGTITATANEYSYTPNNSGSTTKGAAIAIAQHTTVLALTATLKGGTLNGVEAIGVTDVNNDMSNVTVTATQSFTENSEIPAGYKWVESGNGKYELAACEYVAQIGDVKYESLQEALNAGGNVVLLADVAGAFTVATGKTVVLDLNGYTISSNSNDDDTLTVEGNLTINDSSNPSNGKITGKWPVNVINGTLTFNAGTVEAVEMAGWFSTNSNVTINGGTFTSASNAVLGTPGNSGKGGNTITVNDGTFNGSMNAAGSANGYIACGIYAANDDAWTLNGGTFNITNGAGIVQRGGEVIIPENSTVEIHTTGDVNGKVGDSRVVVPCSALVFDSAANYPGLTATSEMEVKGGEFTSEAAAISVVAKEGDAQYVEVSGGAFSSVVDIDYCATGYEPVTTADTNTGLYTVEYHEHDFHYNNPNVLWRTISGRYSAVFVYTCSCGKTEMVIVDGTDDNIGTIQHVDNQGIRTYTATDVAHNQVAQTEKKVLYSVKFNSDDDVFNTYEWGQICVLTADSISAWYVGSVAEGNMIADGVKTYSFGVISDTVIWTKATDALQPVAAVAATMTCTQNGTAAFNAKWSLPIGAKVKSVKIYRGYTSEERVVAADTLIAYGTVFNVNLLVLNGNFKLNLSGLTTSKWQHAVIVITYQFDGGDEQTLVSAVQRILPVVN